MRSRKGTTAWFRVVAQEFLNIHVGLPVHFQAVLMLVVFALGEDPAVQMVSRMSNQEVTDQTHQTAQVRYASRIDHCSDRSTYEYCRKAHTYRCMFQRHSAIQDFGPTYKTLADGRRQMSLHLDASGFDPRDVRVLVDRNQLLVDAACSESHSVPITSRDVTSGHRSDASHRRLSRRYLLPGCVRADDLRCLMTSDGTLSIEGQVRGPGNSHVTSTGDSGGKTWRGSSKHHVKFDLS